MQLNITTHHLDLTDAIKSHLEEKLQKVKRHFDKVIDIKVILEVDNNTQSAEATVHMSGFDVFAKADDDDMYIAIDKMVKKLDSQVVKHKEKIKSHR
jgi:putative sigma-54 modulation protein